MGKTKNFIRAITLGNELIPEQKFGSSIDAIQQIECGSVEEAELFYNIVKARLLDVNCWAEHSKLPISAFKLFGSDGKEANRSCKEGDFIRIDIPGTGTRTGQGYDWVSVELIKQHVELNTAALTLRVRPCPYPQSGSNTIAHFLQEHATSTFQVKWSQGLISAEEHGRNEMSNTKTSHVLDNVRNLIVGLCAKFGFAYPQWKSLVMGLLEYNEK